MNSSSSNTTESKSDSTCHSSEKPVPESSDTTGSFECNICLDSAKDAVVSLCGHLFCWSCLHQWLETVESRLVCPVCKAAISKDKVIPLYGRGGDHTRDPRTKIPPRPAGRRTEPDPGLGSFGSTLGGLFGGTAQGGFRMAVGVGAFPFGFLATSFNLGGGFGGGGAAGAANASGTNPDDSLNPLLAADSETMSKLCLLTAILFIICLLIA